MKGDFTRNTFNPLKHYSRVLMQQGRVQVDADWNEQAAILLHYLQTLASDLIGPHGGPRGAVGFEIGGGADDRGFGIGPGRYYVEGVLCENEPRWDENGNLVPLPYLDQPDYPNPPDLPGLPFLVYLDVWERHITYLQDPDIREVALGGPDTSTRARIVWQVKVQPDIAGCPGQDEWQSLMEQWQPRNRGRLRAGAREFEVEDDTEPCTVDPESNYRGAENQLYRVEIHTGSTLAPGEAGEVTFKWSRENGSVVFPILQLNGAQAILEHLGRDDRYSLLEGDWVEIVDDGITLRNEANPLLKVASIDRDRLAVTLEAPEGVNLPEYDETTTAHPYLRRWDHKERDTTLGYPALGEDGAMVLEEADWLVLEDGIQVYFEADADRPAVYRTGDYWLIPARTATGDVEWPGEPDAPEFLPPHGIQHAYAPLAVISQAAGGDVRFEDCRREIRQLWDSPPA